MEYGDDIRMGESREADLVEEVGADLGIMEREELESEAMVGRRRVSKEDRKLGLAELVEDDDIGIGMNRINVVAAHSYVEVFFRFSIVISVC